MHFLVLTAWHPANLLNFMNELFHRYEAPSLYRNSIQYIQTQQCKPRHEILWLDCTCRYVATCLRAYDNLPICLAYTEIVCILGRCDIKSIHGEPMLRAVCRTITFPYLYQWLTHWVSTNRRPYEFINYMPTVVLIFLSSCLHNHVC